MPNKHSPPPNTWNNTNQHWIPQFLLRSFDVRGKASRVYEMDKQSGVIKLRAIKDIASRQGLLTERDDTLMQQIEMQASPVIRGVRKEDFNITWEDRQALDNLVLVLMHIDPYTGVNLTKLREDIVTDKSRDYSEAIRRQGGLVNRQDLKKLFNDFFPEDYLELAMTEEVSESRIALGLMGLSVHETAKGEHLVIGDSPVLVLRAVYGGSPNLLHPGSQVILPIHSRHVLVYRWVTQESAIQAGSSLDKEQVRSLGKDYYHQTDSRYIYGRTEVSLKHAQVPQTKKPLIPQSTEVSDGWAAMQVIQQKISNLRAKQDKVDQQERDTIARYLVQNAIHRLTGKE